MFKDMKYLKSSVTFLFPNDSRTEAIRKMGRVQERIREKVLELAVRVATTRHDSETQRATQLPYPGAIPSGNALENFSATMLDMIQEYGDPTAMNIEPNRNADSPNTFAVLYQAARKEIAAYASDYADMRLALDPLVWWSHKSKQYPILSRCVRILFSVPASSGPLELDIGHTGMILTKQRSSLKGDIAEAATVLNRNRDLVDLVNVDAYSAAQLNEKLPKDLAVENSNAASSLFGALDIHFPISMHQQTSEMMDAIAFEEMEE